MDIIHLLPDNVANQIAAGEVIQRPASCLKELVENSLDAGATSVQVIVREAGRALMQVIDNGKGMSPTDARMAFERHATSKISCAADLFSLQTMGFRGEALASICAVAQVEVVTKREEDEMGTLIEIYGSDVQRQEAVATTTGTNFKVKNLFYNVPARRRFLKTNATELRNIITEYNRIVLVNPQCHFLLVSDDEVLSDLPAGSFKQRIEQVFGRTKQTFTSSLVEISTETELVSIHGFIGKPESANKMPQQFFFVNNRFMRHPYFHKAVMTAYQGMLLPDHTPSYFIYFDIHPDAIDVNIHPTKTEIKFADEQAIWQILLAAVRESLGKFNIVPSIDFESEVSLLDLPHISETNAAPLQAPQVSFNPTYNPFDQRIAASTYQPRMKEEALIDWQEEAPLNDESQDAAHFDLPDIAPMQVMGRYITVPMAGALLFVDQHRAHQTICYHEISIQLDGQKGMMQQMLFPETITLNDEQMQLMRTLRDDLQDAGFDLEQLGHSAFAINSIPALLGNKAPQPILLDILAYVSESGGSAHEQWRKQIATSMARSVAIPYGKLLSVEEMQDLLKRLFALKEHAYTPEGKPVMTSISQNELDKRF